MRPYLKALKDAHDAVNVLGAPDTACTTPDELEYCRAIGDALVALEVLQLNCAIPTQQDRMGALLAQLRAPKS